MNKIKVVIIEDHNLICEGLINCLKEFEHIWVMDSAKDGLEGIKLVEKLKPDVIILDYNLPKFSGLEVTKEILKKSPKAKILILTVHENQVYAFSVIKAGARGYLLKDKAVSELVKAIETIDSGHIYVDESISQSLIEDFVSTVDKYKQDDSLLNNKEKQILKFLAEGYDTKTIAKKFSIVEKTVLNHRESLMKKMQLKNSSDIVKCALKMGIIEID